MSAEEQLQSMIGDEDDLDLDTYGLAEFRDGFFDALFLKPRDVDLDGLMQHAETTLPASLLRSHPLSWTHLWHATKGIVRRVTTTASGIRLVKSFIAVFAAYIMCLIPSVRAWLGRYSYILVVSCIIDHPARTFGAQLDGVLSTMSGTALGLGWGALSLWVSTSTSPARNGYGGILAMFLCLLTAAIAFVRSHFIRFYQLVLCAGIAVIFASLVETGESVIWVKLRYFGVPWALGQAICMIINVVFFPDVGARALALAFHKANSVMLDGLVIPNPEPMAVRRLLAHTFVSLTQAYRDFAIDVSITRVAPPDTYELRNLMQAVIRSLLALKTETHLFDLHESAGRYNQSGAEDDDPYGLGLTRTRSSTKIPVYISPAEEKAVRVVCQKLADPTRELLNSMRDSLTTADAVLMHLLGYRAYHGTDDLATRLRTSSNRIRQGMNDFDDAETPLFAGDLLPKTYSTLPGVVELFVFCRPVRQAADAVERLMLKIGQMQESHPSLPRLRLPSYPVSKSLNRLNAQVRHDRGGITAGSYYKTFAEIARSLQGIMSTEHYPLPQDEFEMDNTDTQHAHATMEAEMDEEPRSGQEKFRYKAWKVLHSLQGYETKYSFKCVLVVILLSVPAWLSQSRDWWNRYESWWSVVMAWVMMHPRVGGNFQDLMARALTAVLGAVWSGLGYAAGNGNPYVMGVFAAIYFLPMLYRFTQSRHARSGVVGCLSFAVVSLSLVTADGAVSTVRMTWSTGLAFVVGVVAAVLINWLLWPFVARHELGKAISSMLFFLSIYYRRIVAKYVYYEEGENPTAEDIKRSEILERRIREGFVRIRQLMELTLHEIRLRAPFDVRPYSALADACERFFEYLVEVRQASLFFQPNFVGDEEIAARVLTYRRDAVASILSNLYVLAGALRAGRKVPRYLPSAAAARKRLLDKMSELEVHLENIQRRVYNSPSAPGKKWAQIYQYSFNESLTGCVAQLEELERYTKLIVGEQRFDFTVKDEDSDTA
ncbi:Brefeldin A-sensitivity 4 protein [Pleurostoma richardsiae]|uniref:Brefeldin A-sensitivity 4 protein n=1 Tax=Pleurostoma richardsiae TaxID=41990 RepID=A0AA38VX25_9PEZI|nr:Brefeldin A-sensitivity 4 protein [Pleurostoma richardsiae]